MVKNFRLCAGAIVFNKEGKILLGNRIETEQDAWQFPQGGIEEGETPLIAAKRELFEETSVCSVIPLYTDEKPHRYEFSEDIKKSFRKRGITNDGQDIYFSLFFFNGTDEEIDLKTKQPEFRDYSWETLEFAVDNIISFKKDVYTAIAKKVTPLIQQYLASLT